MPESIVIQTGQCGNQIGARFWDLILQEQAKYNTDGLYDASLSTFYRNVSIKRGQQHIPVGNGKTLISGLKARAVLIDMEQGVLNQIQKSPIGELFDDDQFVSSVSGSGNNWAVGYHVYGSEYKEAIIESTRKQAEYCDHLESFFMLGSLGGGTGSGLGSFATQILKDEFPNVFQFASCICPSETDDVVTSPYNTMFSLSKLIENVDTILPVENQSLLNILKRIPFDPHQQQRQFKPTITDNGPNSFGILKPVQAKSATFDSMNNIVANLLMNLTSSVRFQGSMNVDMNDIVTNMVPFPKLKFLFSSMTPLYNSLDLHTPLKMTDQMFTDAFRQDNQLLRGDPKNSMYLAAALMLRGQVEISDLRRNIDRIRQNLNFVSWNQDGWKTGLCNVPPINQKQSLLSLSNTTCIQETLNFIKNRFLKLYKRRANLHHYTEYMDPMEIQESLETVRSVIKEYGSYGS